MENPAEVQELRNKLRMMKFPQDDILNIVRRQQRAIHKQKQANETIRNEITMYEEEIMSFEKADKEYKSSEDRLNLETKKKNLSNKLGILQADFKAEDDKRKRLEEEVSRARFKCGGLYAQTKENEGIQNRLHNMENRLDQAFNRYNKHLRKLESLRLEIDELRKQRFAFVQIYSQTIQDEKAKDEQISSLISASNDAYQMRDNLKNEIIELKNTEKQHRIKFEQEINRYTQMIEGQAVLARHPRNEQIPIPSISSQSGSSADQQEELQKETEKMTQLVDQTLKNTGTGTIEELFEKFSALESENYSLFSFVVEHGAEKTRLMEEIQDLEAKNHKLNMETQIIESEQNLKLQELTATMEDTERQLEESKATWESNKERMEYLYKEIETLFNELGCSWDNSPDEKNYVTSVNALFCLSQIENIFAEMMNTVANRASVLLTTGPVRDRSSNSADERSGISASRLQGMNTTANISFIHKPGSENKPLSLEEIRARLGVVLTNN